MINYTTSDSPEVYIHRTGRTGRAGKSGVAISLISGLDIGNFKHMQIVNKIKITEKKVPTERDLARRAAKREQGDAEEAMNALKQKASKDLEALSSEDSSAKIDEFLPFVKKLSADEDGLRELASICSAYSIEQPTPAVATPAEDSPPEPASEDGDEADVADKARADERPAEARSRRRRSSSGSGSGGSRSGGDGNRGSSRGRRGGSDSRRS